MLDFHKDTPEAVRNALTTAYNRRQDVRVRLWYGDTTTGLAWCEENDVIGYVARSTGRVKAPLIIFRRNSDDGPVILDHRIVRIDHLELKSARSKQHGVTVYQHPTFSHGLEYARIEQESTEMFAVRAPHGETLARFKDRERAKRWLDFMRGDRYIAW